MDIIDKPAVTGVAIYWDFENLHAAVLEDLYGSGYYSTPDSRFRLQEPVLDLAAINGFAATVGPIHIHRAYGNWQWFSRYRTDLMEHSLELIQLFPPGGQAKNGADIRIALDIQEDLIRFPHISHVIVVGGDSDYLPLAQKVKALGRQLIGIGEQNTTNKFWARSCHEFKYYHVLISKSGTDVEKNLDFIRDNADVEDAARLLVKAIHQLRVQNGEQRVLKAKLRPMMMRLDSTFDESNYGFVSFNDLLQQCAAYMVEHSGDHDNLVALSDKGQTLLQQNAPNVQHNGSEDTRLASVDAYRKILAQGGIRLLAPEARGRIIEAIVSAVSEAENERMSSFRELEQAAADIMGVSMQGAGADINSVRHMLYRLRLFKLFKENGVDAGVSLSEMAAPATFATMGEDSLVRYVARYADQPMDYEALYDVLYAGDHVPKEQRMSQMKQVTGSSHAP